MKIGVLGSGTWGTALARMLALNGNEVVMWSALESEVKELCEKYELTIKEITIGEMVPMGNVKSATSTLAVEGDEINVKQMAEFIVSQKQIARIDTMAMTEQADGSVLASFVIVNFTK